MSILAASAPATAPARSRRADPAWRTTALSGLILLGALALALATSGRGTRLVAAALAAGILPIVVTLLAPRGDTGAAQRRRALAAGRGRPRRRPAVRPRAAARARVREPRRGADAPRDRDDLGALRPRADRRRPAYAHAPRGRRVLLAAFVLQAFSAPERVAPHADPELEQLTPRERDVLHNLARGYPYKRIATRLGISPRTVETHVSSVLRKLQLSTRHELSRWASLRGLAGADDTGHERPG